MCICEIVCVYAKLFKTILDTGIIPERWTIVIIRSIYKNNGNSKNLDSHRTITLISCLGKLFTGILNSRQTNISTEFDLIYKYQAVFRKGISTNNNIFFLLTCTNTTLFVLCLKIFCCFVDFVISLPMEIHALLRPYFKM